MVWAASQPKFPPRCRAGPTFGEVPPRTGSCYEKSNLRAGRGTSEPKRPSGQEPSSPGPDADADFAMAAAFW